MLSRDCALRTAQQNDQNIQSRTVEEHDKNIQRKIPTVSQPVPRPTPSSAKSPDTGNKNSELGADAEKEPPKKRIWASLACDYLAIMASSVSSKRAFLSVGITVTKRCNRLKGDIVEVLQFLKCWYKQDLLFREPPPSSTVELSIMESEVGDMVDALMDSGNHATSPASETPRSWDELIIEDSNKEDPDIFEL
ncbi:hypothetical protein D9757_010753 [Collybiopsis confluens]|uniref:HAT C-terminal dimerisation domain-containing protein n=1 Tax=Collybiopsis confluens TaxID=2823264 RepID=A0A8H5H845_9AGAR|nr:hypothetical protein D9757_010753 [Collybiopsis confluens]